MYATLGLLNPAAGGGGPGPEPEVFPTLTGRTRSETGANTTVSRSITLPSSISVGQMIVIVVSLSSGSITTPPSGYTQVSSLPIYRKAATGSEGSTVVSFSLNSNGPISNQSSLVFSNASQIEAGRSSASSSNANPPSLTVSWGAANNLFIALVHSVGLGVNRTAYPANCPLYQTDNSGSLDEYIAGAESLLATFNPDAFATSSGDHYAFTLGLTA